MNRMFMLLFALAVTAGAQSKLVFTEEFQVYGLFSMPTGDFASTTADRAGFALPGFGIGADVMMVSDKNVAIVGSVNYSRNSRDGEAILKEGGFPAGATIEDRSFSTTYLLAGARVNIPVTETVRPFVMAQGGILFASYPGLNISDNVISIVASSSSSSAMAFSLSAGARVFSSFDLSVRYFRSEPEFKSEASVTMINGTFVWEGKMPISALMVVVGYAF
ncbi:MAG: outer membrane beta-barrel protein [Bacteroidetes bacterium]|nr:outer membrane beta-barrel protein [Bacteroidota bacterium]